MWINIALIGSIVTLAIFVFGITYRAGRWEGESNQRLKSLEEWRGNIRTDMHEISDKLENLSKQMTALTTLIEERTERRNGMRDIK